jgi:peptidoglycan hydrolase-like protein with peptidoglycan-binding domain
MNLKLDQRGDDVRALHTETELLGIAVPDAERQQGHFGPGTRDAVTRFQTAHGLPATGIVDAATVAAIDAVVADTVYVVSGTASSPDRAGVNGLRVRMIDRNVAEDVELSARSLRAR